jgi:hypothetical protein
LPVVPPIAICSESVRRISKRRRAVFGHAVEGAAVGVGDGLGREQDALEQPVDVALLGERGADLVELLEAAKQVAGVIDSLTWASAT